MAKINVTVDEWPDLVAAFLFDKLVVPDMIGANKEFNELMNDLEKKGAKSLLMSYYLHMDPGMRIQYKRLKKTFETNDKGVIEVRGVESAPGEKKKKDSITKRLAKKLVGKILASKKLPKEEKNYLVELIKEDIE